MPELNALEVGNIWDGADAAAAMQRVGDAVGEDDHFAFGPRPTE